jgi:WD40 repeat protein
MKLFISYTTQDRQIAESLVPALKAALPGVEPFLDQQNLVGGSFWLPKIDEEIKNADAFLFLFGEKLGPYQAVEYYAAFDRRTNDQDLPIAPVLMSGANVPGLPFFSQLQWITAADPLAPDGLSRIVRALQTKQKPENTQLWKLMNPYRGLQSLREQDAGLLFGRDALVESILDWVSRKPKKVLLATGYSGVGKSSLIYAGVFGCLARQAWPTMMQKNSWPSELAASRSWVRLAFRPRNNPFRELAKVFVSRLRDPKSPQFSADVDEWSARLRGTDNSVAAMRTAAPKHIDRLLATADANSNLLGVPISERFIFFIDQAEELYSQTSSTEAALFTTFLSEAARNDRVQILMSMRSDFLKHVHNDTDFDARADQIAVPKLSEQGLREVVEKPAATLGVTFEPGLAGALVDAAAKVPLGLPLLSYQLTDLWAKMSNRNDGILRWAEKYADAIDLSKVLVAHADKYLKEHEGLEDVVRRLFCVRLIHVSGTGIVTRRIALKSELTDTEAAVATDLSGADFRLLATGETVDERPTIEIGHEALLSTWSTLINWISDRRTFYAWRTRLEADRIDWERAGRPKDRLLVSRALEVARTNLEAFRLDIPPPEVKFIAASAAAADRSRSRRRAATSAAFAVLSGLLVAIVFLQEEAREVRDQALTAQSQFLARDANQLLDQGDPDSALLLSLAALPRNLSRPERPFVPIAIETLARAASGLRVERIYRGHSNVVTSVAYSPDGARILAASADRTTHVWSPKTNEVLILRGHALGVTSASFSGDGALVVTASADGTARIWDSRNGRVIHVLSGHGDRVNSAAFSPDAAFVVTASDDRTARIWEVASGHEVKVLRGHGLEVTSAKFSPDGLEVVTSSFDGTARLWIVATGRQRTILRGHIGPVTQATYSGDGESIATASGDCTVKIWDRKTSKLRLTLRGHNLAVNSVAFSKNSDRIVTSSWDHTTRIWSAETGDQLAVVRGHSASVTSAAFSPSADTVVTGSWDNTVRVSNASEEVNSVLLKGHELAVTFAKFSADGNLVLTTSVDKSARVWDARSGQQRQIFLGHLGVVTSGDLSRDGELVATASLDGTVRVWETATGRQLSLINPCHCAVNAVLFAPDTGELVTATDDGILRKWSGVTLQQKSAIDLKSRILSIAYSPDRSRLMAIREDGHVNLWDTSSHDLKLREPLISLAIRRPMPVVSASFSADGTLFAIASDRSIAWMWNALTGKVVGAFNAPTDAKMTIALSPIGQRVATASSGDYATLWDAHNWTTLLELSPHHAPITSMSFSTDGTRLLTASEDHTVRISYLPKTCQELIDQAAASSKSIGLEQSEDLRKRFFLEGTAQSGWLSSYLSGFLIVFSSQRQLTCH